MKSLLCLLVLLLFVSCGPKKPSGGDVDIVKGPNFGQCVSNEEAAALGVSKKCSAPGCVCIEDVHGKEHRKEAHCHSEAAKCD